MKKLAKTLAAGTIAISLSGFTFDAVSADQYASVPELKTEISKDEFNEKKHWKKDDAHSVDGLRLIGSETVPNDLTYKGTSVGGLSGLSYNPKGNKWILISDDRSAIDPARFYTAKLNYNHRDFQSVHVIGVTPLKQADGTFFPDSNNYNSEKNSNVPDFESIRFDPVNKTIWYTSEGDRSLGLNPLILQAQLDGSYLSRLPLTDTAKMDDQSNKGFRNNLALEGTTFSADGLTLWTAMEGPLIQDDQVPTLETGSLSRITQYNRNGNVLNEFAYTIDPIPAEPGEGMAADNGVSEILSINDNRFLVLERSAVQADDGSYSNYIRIYKIDVRGATDISEIESLKSKDITPVKKELVLNLNSLGLDKLDNIEGMSWGKELPNGNDSLVLVSDNNFNDSQVTQFIAFEVLPERE
ncbi:esterase-like activity of phytase family protein [Virgibacillus necropolis]|uniref:Phytase-like domain-containing protein n=1 Tax=Virgibacillus necropolis TaxID=163877 RepID=A0A221MCM1_9BACI|nr:esterase-like activity of phytase family protein [Virgibacillus necropolis]ASN05395.1 hypothetical protein CFK40_10415 [Virgibacillus necropolis]